jgi:DHA1 family bicyclomycin/chloramphenicol resistance-like MFS transporter
MVFLTPPLFAVIVFIWSLRLEESLPRDQRIALSLGNIGQSIRKVVSNQVFLRYTAITTVLFAGLSSYVSSSEHIVGEIYNRPELFAWIFAGIGLGMAFCTLVNSRLSSRYGARRTIRGLLVIYTVVGALLQVYTFMAGDPPDMVLFFVAVAILMGINLAIEPNSSALAMEPMGDIAGMASAVYGTSFFFIGASLGALISNLMVNGVLPLVFGFFVIGLTTIFLVFSDKRPLERQVS